MTTRESKTIFYYLLDMITRRNHVTIDETLPQDIKEDLEFSMWLQNVDFSEDSELQNILRRQLEKQAELVQNANRIKHPELIPAIPQPRKISLAALIGIILGGVSMLVAALLVIFRKRKGEVSSKPTL